MRLSQVWQLNNRVLIITLAVVALCAVYISFRKRIQINNLLDSRLVQILKIEEGSKTLQKLQELQHLQNQTEISSDITESESDTKPWYFSGGNIWPIEVNTNNEIDKREAKLFPFEDHRSDRIINQLMFVPTFYEQYRETGQLKKILLFNGNRLHINEGQQDFLSAKCPVNTCTFTNNTKTAGEADLIIFEDHYTPTGILRSPKQIYMMYTLEGPFNTLPPIDVPDVFNWTATYRKDSDIVKPYGKWVYYDERIKQRDQNQNYALNKTKKVAWFVSNCEATNNRLEYANELNKYIQVDIYGKCGTLACPKSNKSDCFEKLHHNYKFYLSFENSNCKDYITEKLFVNALSRNILPIVMGARPEEYENVAPYRSYIHVDDFESPKELANYLNILDKNDDLYNSYFNWKGTGEFLDFHTFAFFLCRVCAMLHDEASLEKPNWYKDINVWWRGPGVCTNGPWKKSLRTTVKTNNKNH